MNINLPPEVKLIFKKFTQAGFKIYLVGGAVRDLLLNKVTKDFDFTTNAKPEQILEVFPQGYYNNNFGTVGINLNNQLFEVTTMRKEEAYTDFRHPAKVEWSESVEEDLK